MTADVPISRTMVRNMTSSCAHEAAILILRPGRRAPLLAMSPLLLLAALAASVSALPPAPAFLPQPLQDLLNNQDFQQQLQVSCDWSRDDGMLISDWFCRFTRLDKYFWAHRKRRDTDRQVLSIFKFTISLHLLP